MELVINFQTNLMQERCIKLDFIIKVNDFILQTLSPSTYIRVFLQPAPCLAPCLVNFSLYKYGAIRSSAPFHLVNLTRSYTELTRSRPQIAPCLAPYGSVFSSVLGKSDKIFKIWKKSKRLKSALNTQLSMKE